MMRVASKRSPAGQQLIKHHAQAEDVRSSIDSVTLATSLLGAHVSRGSSKSRSLAEVLVSEREPEVRDTGLARAVDQDVGGLDVPVDQPPGVGVVKRLGDQDDQFRLVTESGAILANSRRQVATLEELGNDVAETLVGTARVVHRHNVRMFELGEDLRFREISFQVSSRSMLLGFDFPKPLSHHDHRIQSEHRQEDDSMAPEYTPRQGQFLAFIYYYTKIHRIPPSEMDMQRFFRTTPPTVHDMVKTLERRGFIAREPGKPRTIRVLLPRDELPELE